jgi:acetolactate synthase-1/2/3 large subunit
MNQSTDKTTVVTLTTADATVKSLIANGVDKVFGIPGVQNDHLLDAFQRHEEQIRFIHTRHEQGAAYMALGAAMATGDPAVCCVVPGPGFLNTTAALSTAYACNAPVLCLTGQIPAAAIGRGHGHLHEIPDQLGVMRSLTKWAGHIAAPQEASFEVNTAFNQMRSGRPRPTALECPIDVWHRKGPVTIAPASPPHSTPVDVDAIRKAARLLGASRSPLILVGGGAMNAGRELQEVAQILQAPVVSNRMGRGILDSRHVLSVNSHCGHRLWPQADVVLAVGTRMFAQYQQWGVDSDLCIIRVDIDPLEFDRRAPPSLGLVGDASEVLRALADELPHANAKREDRSEEMRVLKATSAENLKPFEPQRSYLMAIRDELPENGIFVDELTQIGYLSRWMFPVYRPRTFITPGYQGTLGWGLATALGVKAARPNVPVVSISGDGGFMFNVQELMTAVQHNIPVVFVLMNDGAFGNVRRTQVEEFDNRVIATELKNPDFIKLVEAFGALALRAHTPEELRLRLRQAFASNQVTVIEVPVGPMPSPWNVLRFPRVRALSS